MCMLVYTCVYVCAYILLMPLLYFNLMVFGFCYIALAFSVTVNFSVFLGCHPRTDNSSMIQNTVSKVKHDVFEFSFPVSSYLYIGFKILIHISLSMYLKYAHADCMYCHGLGKQFPRRIDSSLGHGLTYSSLQILQILISRRQISNIIDAPDLCGHHVLHAYIFKSI